MKYLLYFLFVIINLILTIFFIDKIIDSVLFTTIRMAGSFYFSLFSAFLILYFVFLKRDYKNSVFLFISIIIFMISLTIMIKKSVATDLLGNNFLSISMIFYVISGVLYFYYSSYTYSFFSKFSKDDLFIWTTSLILSLFYFICSPAIYLIL